MAMVALIMQCLNVLRMDLNLMMKKKKIHLLLKMMMMMMTKLTEQILKKVFQMKVLMKEFQKTRKKIICQIWINFNLKVVFIAALIMKKYLNVLKKNLSYEKKKKTKTIPILMMIMTKQIKLTFTKQFSQKLWKMTLLNIQTITQQKIITTNSDWKKISDSHSDLNLKPVIFDQMKQTLILQSFISENEYLIWANEYLIWANELTQEADV
ncbi:MAG: hypothetical protein EZS28_006223 [Streblomastix strix]|uniref:Uncharacterized protein n=1 Tax=Streblomastix strix TaxID=222440 RepID=A0A5J4WTF5_9EUKA|nr:MAG: hypothetical protein EZS28_006223 [Streblomastix strix]